MGVIKIRQALKSDVPLLLQLIKELAEYEKLSHAVSASEELIEESIFGERPSAEAMIAYYNEEPAGIAVYFHNYSTFLGKAGLYLEDVYVKPHLRGKGIGKSLLIELARVAKQRGCGRFEWSVLDWNEPAIKFYKSLGAEAMNEWTVFRLSGEALDKLSQSGS